jgi:hypothetical protein
MPQPVLNARALKCTIVLDPAEVALGHRRERRADVVETEVEPIEPPLQLSAQRLEFGRPSAFPTSHQAASMLARTCGHSRSKCASRAARSSPIEVVPFAAASKRSFCQTEAGKRIV